MEFENSKLELEKPINSTIAGTAAYLFGRVNVKLKTLHTLKY